MRYIVPLSLIMSGLTACVPSGEHQEIVKKCERLEAEAKSTSLQIANLTGRIEQGVAYQVMAKSEKERLSQQAREAEERAKRLAEELEALKKEFAKFKADRRTGMIGRRFPQLALANGKILLEPQIQQVTPSTVRFTHSAGISVVRMADLGDELKWEAVWTESEAEEHEGLLNEQSREASVALSNFRNKQLDALSVHDQTQVAARVSALKLHIPTLEARLRDQRAELEGEYQRSVQNYTRRARTSEGESTIKGVPKNDVSIYWNSAAPEESQLITDWKVRPAGLEFSAVFRIATSIRTTKETLREAQAELQRLESSVRGSTSPRMSN